MCLVQSLQDCCIGTYMARWFAASIPSSPISDISPHVIPPQPPHPCNRLWYVIFPSLCSRVLTVQLPLMSENVQCLVFCSCVNLLRMMVSSFIHVPAKDMNSFFFVTRKYSTVCMCHIFFIQFNIDGHLGWFQVFAIINSAAINICVHVFIVE